MLARLWRRIRDGLENTSLWLILLIVVVGLILFWQIGSTPNGMSAAEKVAVHSSSSLSNIWEQPLNAPHKLLQYSFLKAGLDDAWYMRGTSAFFGLLFVGCVYLIIKNWFGKFVSGLASMLLIGTPFFLILARNATPAIMLLAPLLLVGYYLAFRHKKNRNLFSLGLWLLLAAVLYCSGSVLVLLVMLIFWHKHFLNLIKHSTRLWLVAGTIIFVIAAVPLGKALLDINLLRSWLLLPRYMPELVDIAKQLGWGPLSYVLRTDSGSLFLAGTTAILTLTQVVFMILGIVAMARQALRETIWLSVFIGLAIALYALNNNVVTLLLGLPSVIAFAAAGMRYLYTEWKTVFPKNPIPHGVAVFLLCLVCLQQLVYGVHYSYKVWPHTPQTLKLYMIK